MDIDYSEKDWATPCPKYDCRKTACKCGLEYVNIPTSLGDDSEGSNVAPKNGAYCNALVFYEANRHVYIYTKEGIPTLIDVDASDISTLEQEVRKAQRDIAEFREDIDRFAYFFNTVADMKASTQLSSGDYARTLGYYNRNDGGGAYYKISSTQPSGYYETLGNMLYAELITEDAMDVRQFGAKGDGATDDRPRIVSAINNANELYFSPGTYLINSAIFIPSDKKITGHGDDSVILAGSTFNIINTSDTHNIEISSLKLDGDAENKQTAGTLTEAVNGIAAKHVQDIIIDNVTFTNMGYLPQQYAIDGTSGGDMLRLQVEESSIGKKDTYGCVINNCRFIDPDGRSGFGVKLKSDWDITGTRKYYIRDNKILNCYFEGNNYNNIEIAGQGAIHNIIENCTVKNSKAYVAIEADKGASYNIFNNNLVDGVECLGGQNVWVFNCAWSGNASDKAIGNTFTNTVIRNVKFNQENVCAAFRIGGAEQTIVDNLLIENITPYQSATSGSGIRIVQSENTVISNAILKNVNTQNYGVAIQFDNVVGDVTLDNISIDTCSYGVRTFGEQPSNRIFKVKNCIFKNTQYDGVNIGAQLKNVVVEECAFDRIGLAGISVQNGGNLIANNNIFTNILNSNHFGIDGRGADSEICCQGNYLNGCGIFLGDFTNYKNRILNNYVIGQPFDGVKAFTYAPAAPTSGTWRKGDIIYNSWPSAGGNIGWVCTSNGTPGTWKSFGSIEA